MNINDLKTDDTIKFQLPLFDPQEGKITQKFTDSVVVNDNIHVSEKYIIKKMENKINIKDLKVGDLIKFNRNKNIFQGYIYEINLTQKRIYLSENKPGTHQFCAQTWGAQLEDIICKLELIPAQYKEIPIEKEEYKEKTCIKCQEIVLSGFNLPEGDFICSMYKNKENPASKSFKFDYKMSGYDFWIPLNIMGEMGSIIGKTYTIEITEKQ